MKTIEEFDLEFAVVNEDDIPPGYGALVTTFLNRRGVATTDLSIMFGPNWQKVRDILNIAGTTTFNEHSTFASRAAHIRRATETTELLDEARKVLAAVAHEAGTLGFADAAAEAALDLFPGGVHPDDSVLALAVADAVRVAVVDDGTLPENTPFLFTHSWALTDVGRACGFA